MDLLEILDKNLIDLDLDLKNKDEVIHHLSKLLYENNRVSDLQKYIDSVYERESIGETGMGNFIAIPHGISNRVIKASVAVGRVRKPVEWESLDDNPVELIFLLAIPGENSETIHLKMLAQLASILAHKNNVKMIFPSSSILSL